MNFTTCGNWLGVTQQMTVAANKFGKPALRMASLVTLAVLTGCGAGEPAEPPLAVYFDADRRQPVVMPASEHYPATHPATGRPTLMPAMHCPKCNAWRQVPLPEHLNRSAAPAICAKCRSRLQADGPLPSP